MYLNKTKITKKDDIYNTSLNPLIKKWLLDNKNFTGDISLDYRNRIRTDLSLVPFKINNRIIFKYLDTFQQNNNYLSKKIRKYVLNEIGDEVMCIGCESFIYGLECKKYIYYSNCKKLCFENDFNSKNKSIYIENYNKSHEFKIVYNTLIINLSKLNKELLIKINELEISKIIIINCHHKDFWKKIKYLNKFKLITRNKFISQEYFISVNIFLK